jgi:hypothetical protein
MPPVLVQPGGDEVLSTRLHYLWNSVNNDPFIGLGAITVQPGQAFHRNYAISYEVTSGIRVGLNGYWLKQPTDDKIDGNKIENSRESVIGLGVGFDFFSPKTPGFI